MLTLKALGSLDIRDGRGASVSSLLAQPKRAALLAYLVLSRPGEMHRRDALLALFWPESDQHHGRNALSQALTFLRREVGPRVIRRRGSEEVGVAPEAVTSDVQTFVDAVSRGDWTGALEAYGGDLLEGLHVGGSAPFMEWVDGERVRLRFAAADGAWHQAQQSLAEGDLGGAEAAAHRALHLVPTDEVQVRRFILSLTKAGDRAAAVRFYEDFCARLRDELELEPSAPTEELAAKIRNGDLSPSEWPAEASMSGPPAAGSAGSKGPPPADVPVDDLPGEPSKTRSWRWAVVALAIAGIAYAFPGLKHAADADARPGDRPYTVLSNVEGSAGQIDREAVGFLLRSGLDEARVVRTVPDAEVRRMLDLMEIGADTAVDAATARQVAARLGVSTVVVARLDRFGDRYVFSLRVEEVKGGEVRASVRESADDHGGIVEMVDEAVRNVRRLLGEHSVSLSGSEPLPRVLTPSLEALEQYRLGRALMGQGRARTAVAHLRKAVALDTAFAMAWLALGAAYGNYLDMPDSGAYAGQQVQRFHDRLTEARKEDQELHRRMARDVALWDIGLQEAERAVLRDPTWISNYAVYVATIGGHPDSALDMRLRREARLAAEARRFHPSTPFTTSCFINSLYWAAALDRVGELRAFLDSLTITLPADCDRELTLYESLAGADWRTADSLRAVDTGAWRWPRVVSLAVRQLEPLRGRIGAAYRRPPPANPDKSVAAEGGWPQVARLLLELLYGVPAPDAASGGDAVAPGDLEGRGRTSVTRFTLYGVREALVGDTAESRRVAARLRAMRDSATSRTFERAFTPWFDLMDVGPAWRRGDGPSVIERLEPLVARIQDPGSGYVSGDAYLARWLLADAYVQGGHLRAATVHLEAMLQRPTVRPQDWTLQGFVHPAVRFKLARLYTRMGDEARACDQYRAFLDVFTDPDPEFAWMVDEAKRALEPVAA